MTSTSDKLKTVARTKRAVSAWSGKAFSTVSLADPLSLHRVEPPNSPGLRIDENHAMGDMPAFGAIDALQWNSRIGAASTVGDVYQLALEHLP